MDHLPLPPRARLPYPKVQCLCHRRNRATGILDIPTHGEMIEMMGLDAFEFVTQCFTEGPIQRLPLQDAAHFIQLWLWFGTIEQIFSTVSVVVQLKDFVADDETLGVRLDTTMLHRYLWYWMAAESRVSDEVRAAHCIIISERLERVGQVIMHYAAVEDMGTAPEIENVLTLGPYINDDANNTLLAIALLAETLNQAQRLIYPDMAPKQVSFGSLSLRKWILQAGWCINEVWRIMIRGTKVSMLLYLSRIDRTPQSGTHEKCNSKGCVHTKIDVTTYRPKHISEECICSDVTLAYPEMRKMDSLLCKGHYPVLTYSRFDIFGNRLTVHKPQVVDQTSYVAISHVWSDRLGNLRENALPACQLRQIQDLVNSLYPSRMSDIPFWIDTICVPREHTTRGLAIQSMRHVYQRAEKVLVFDSSLKSLSITAPPEHLLLSIQLTPWSKRLWTLHESVLANSIYFQFQETAIQGEELIERYHTELPHGSTTISLQNLLDDCNGSNGTLCKTLLCAMSISTADSFHELSEHPDLQLQSGKSQSEQHGWVQRQEEEVADMMALIDGKGQDNEIEGSGLASDTFPLDTESPDGAGADAVAFQIASLRCIDKLHSLLRRRFQKLRAQISEMDAALSKMETAPAFIHHLDRWTDQVCPPDVQPAVPVDWLNDTCLTSSVGQLTKMIQRNLSRCGSFGYWLRGFDPVFEHCYHFYFKLRLGSVRINSYIKSSRELNHEQIIEAVSAVCWRTTSWKEDEAVCLAIMLNLDVKAVQQAAPSERMEVLVRMWSATPRGLLFLCLPRMATEGLRWMPRSFLNSDWAGSSWGTSKNRKGERTDKGLVVEAMGGLVQLDDLRAVENNLIMSLIYKGDCYDLVFSKNEEYTWDRLKGRLIALIFDVGLDKTTYDRGVLVTVEGQIDSDSMVYGGYELFFRIHALEENSKRSAWVKEVMAEEIPEPKFHVLRPTFTSTSQRWCIG